MTTLEALIYLPMALAPLYQLLLNLTGSRQANNAASLSLRVRITKSPRDLIGITHYSQNPNNHHRLPRLLQKSHDTPQYPTPPILPME